MERSVSLNFKLKHNFPFDPMLVPILFQATLLLRNLWISLAGSSYNTPPICATILEWFCLAGVLISLLKCPIFALDNILHNSFGDWRFPSLY